MKKGILYTANKHNKNLFKWEDLANVDRLKNPLNYDFKKGAPSIVDQYKNSKNWLGISKADNPFSKGNIGGTMSDLVGGLGQAAGAAANKIITGGFNKGVKAGNAVANIGGQVGSIVSKANPLVGGIISVGSGIVGGGINRAFGHQENDETTALVNANNANIRSSANALSQASSNEDILNYGSMAGGATNISDKGFKNGWFNSDGTDAKDRLDVSQNAAFKALGHGLVTGAANADQTNDDNTFKSFYALGGPINTETMGAIDYGFMSDYLTAKDRAVDTKNKLNNNIFGTLPSTMFALGGDIQTNGADFTTGLSRINAGGSHEENPYEGVQVGISRENGQPDLVEEGETIFDDYVYSRRIKIDKKTKDKFHISKKSDMSYADLSKKLEKEAEERPNDPISQNALSKQLHELADEQERQKDEEKAREAQEQFAQLSPEEQTAIMQQVAMQQGQQEMPMAEEVSEEAIAPIEQQMPQQQEIPMNGGEAEGYAYGGNLFLNGGPEGNYKEVDNRSLLRKLFGDSSFVTTMENLADDPLNTLTGGQIDELIGKLGKLAQPEIDKFFNTSLGQKVAKYIVESESDVKEAGVRNGAVNTARRMARPISKIVAQSAKKAYATTKQVAQPVTSQVLPKGNTPNPLPKGWRPTKVGSTTATTNVGGVNPIVAVTAQKGLTTSRAADPLVAAADQAAEKAARAASFASKRSAVGKRKVGKVAAMASPAVLVAGVAQNIATKDNKKESPYLPKKNSTIGYQNPYNKNEIYSTLGEAQQAIARYENTHAHIGNAQPTTVEISSKNIEYQSVAGNKFSTYQEAALDTYNYTHKKGKYAAVDTKVKTDDKALSENNKDVAESKVDKKKNINISSATKKQPVNTSVNFGNWKDDKADHWGTYTKPGLQSFIDNAKRRIDMAPDEETKNAIRQEVADTFNSLQNGYSNIYSPDATNLNSYSQEVEDYQNAFNSIGGNTGFYTTDENGNTTNLIAQAINTPNGANTKDIVGTWADGYRGPRTSIRNWGSTQYGDEKYYDDLIKQFDELGLDYAPNENATYKNGDNTYNLYGLTIQSPTAVNEEDNSVYDPTTPGTSYTKNENVQTSANTSNTATTGVSSKKEESIEYDPIHKEADVYRNLGLMGPAVGLGMMAAGIGKPDYSRMDQALATINQSPALASYRPIGNYMTYKPMDIWSEQNRLNASTMATNRAIQNNNGILGTKMAGLLANDYNSQLANAELYKKSLEYNDALNKQVQDFNRGTDIQNANAYNQISATNAGIINSARQQRAQMAMENALQRMNADASWYNSLYGNVNNLFKGFGALGKENAQHNMIADMVAAGLAGTPNGSSLFNGLVQPRRKAKGGKIKRDKK